MAAAKPAAKPKAPAKPKAEPAPVDNRNELEKHRDEQSAKPDGPHVGDPENHASYMEGYE